MLQSAVEHGLFDEIRIVDLPVAWPEDDE
jgi:hypothetical protein